MNHTRIRMLYGCIKHIQLALLISNSLTSINRLSRFDYCFDGFTTCLLNLIIHNTGQWYLISCIKKDSPTPDMSTESKLLTSIKSITDDDDSVKFVGSLINCDRLYWWHNSVIFLADCAFKTLRLKSPRMTMSAIPVSIAIPIEFSISENTREFEFGGR